MESIGPYRYVTVYKDICSEIELYASRSEVGGLNTAIYPGKNSEE